MSPVFHNDNDVSREVLQSWDTYPKFAAHYQDLLEKQLKSAAEIYQKLQTNAVSIIDFIAGRIDDGKPGA